MNSPSREEIDSKLATFEARLEGCVAAIQASIDGLLAHFDERAQRTDERIEALSRRTDERFARLEDLLEKTQTAISNLKTTTIVTGISAVIAIVLGVGAINATLLSNMIAAFQAGGNMGATQAEVKRQVQETAVLLKQLQEARMQPAVPAKSANSKPSRQP